jgi:hypothetical protein
MLCEDFIMKGWFFAISILAASIYTLFGAFVGLDPSYGVYAILILICSELLYDKWQEKKNANKA